MLESIVHNFLERVECLKFVPKWLQIKVPYWLGTLLADMLKPYS